MAQTDQQQSSGMVCHGRRDRRAYRCRPYGGAAGREWLRARRPSIPRTSCSRHRRSGRHMFDIKPFLGGGRGPLPFSHTYIRWGWRPCPLEHCFEPTGLFGSTHTLDFQFNCMVKGGVDASGNIDHSQPLNIRAGKGGVGFGGGAEPAMGDGFQRVAWQGTLDIPAGSPGDRSHGASGICCPGFRSTSRGGNAHLGTSNLTDTSKDYEYDNSRWAFHRVGGSNVVTTGTELQYYVNRRSAGAIYGCRIRSCIRQPPQTVRHAIGDSGLGNWATTWGTTGPSTPEAPPRILAQYQHFHN